MARVKETTPVAGMPQPILRTSGLQFLSTGLENSEPSLRKQARFFFMALEVHVRPEINLLSTYVQISRCEVWFDGLAILGSVPAHVVPYPVVVK